MRVMFDSAEPLEKVLRTVGALYGVELSAVPPSSAYRPAKEATESSAGRRGRQRSTGKPRPQKTNGRARRASSVDTAAVRRWAQQHGYEVSDRGRVPNAVVDAYQAESAQGS